MNLKRLEMMRVMMERVVAGSWTPTNGHNDLADEFGKAVAKDFVITQLELDSWYWSEEVNQKGQTCGFSACAIGHACFDEEFRKLGWSWSGSQPAFKEIDGWSGIQDFFEFKHIRTGKLLFLDDSYSKSTRDQYKRLPRATRQAKMVADRIDILMKTTEHNFLLNFG